MGFNQKQMQAINTVNGPVMVVSCPGSGKTTVIVNRAKHLIDIGIPEARILIITFTKASAEEMKERYINKFGPTSIVFATIHSVCLAMIKQAYGLKNDVIISASEQYQIMTDWLKDEAIKDLDVVIPMIYTGISYCKNRGISPQEYSFEEDVISEELFCDIYNQYQEYKDKKGLLDFDDILIMARDLIYERKDWLAYFQSLFQYIMIDEYQDTNKIQADIFYALARVHQNICVVGDDDQSIYAFRAADSSIMMNFEKEFPNCTKIFMDTNYRSCPQIIEHASAVIRNNTIRFSKKFQVGRRDKGTVRFVSSTDTVDEVIEMLQTVYKDKTKNPEDYAVLFRTHNQASLLINQLISKKIPFQAADKLKDIHDNIIYQDILSFWRLANNKALPYDFQKIMNKPNRFFKKQDFAHIKGIVGINRTEIFKVIDNIASDWQRRAAREKMKELLNNLMYMQNQTPDIFFDILERDIEYLEYLKDYSNWTNKSLDEILTIYEILKKEAKKYYTMTEWIDSVKQQQIIMLQKKKKDNKKEGFILSTFHSSKGLEWKNVIIIDANEGYSPISKAQSDEEIEEERRLFYVAMTRAKDNLTIYSLAFDSKHPVSRFVTEAMKPVEVEFAEDEKIEKKEKNTECIKLADIPQKPESIAKEEEKTEDFVIPFGIAKDCMIQDTDAQVLRWYMDNIQKGSKYFFVSENIQKYFSEKTAVN